MSHTPGPWEVTDSGVRDRGGYIAHTHRAQRYPGQNERYAREVAMCVADKLLISAAPDLLAALEAINAECLDNEQCGLDYKIPDALVARVRAAIAKARGE